NNVFGAQGFMFPNGSTIAMQRHGDIAGTASALLGTMQFVLPAVAAGFLGVLDDPAMPMAIIIFGCSAMALLFNVTMVGSRLDTEVVRSTPRAV
ncbi:MAG: hypothetical protein ABI824_14150, partial [Acidobacteriota bacterium]